jgi:hypothetical protein
MVISIRMGTSCREEKRVNEKQLFGVLVRAMGVLFLIDGFRTLWLISAQWAFGTRPQEFFLELTAPNLLYGLLLIVLASTMIRWPGWVVTLAWLDHLPTIGRDTNGESNE